ncbi:hypothetical protein SCHPADRAFT_931767 [Schizopora paradoxa]|uniref:MYND-type domain-containing protein n=1 Tax=Schizopora paradoxa TaxID=27342 RepID=A0A0H2RG53_9AGAM|nr:hypothetical protein SCHPADRAFT_931767 [Schizopora paradoxa]
MASQSNEVEEWLRNPRRATDLAKAGSRKHVLAIPTTIGSIALHLRHTALEAILLYCSAEVQDLELAEALLGSIASLAPDLEDPDDLPPKAPRRGSTRPSSHRTFENLIVRYSDVVCKMLRLCSAKSDCFSKDGISAASILDPARLRTQIQTTGTCLQAIASNKSIGAEIFKDDNMLRVPIRFWLATVLESRPGDANPIVHEALFSCGNIRYFSSDSTKFFDILIEENGGDAHDTAALFISELRTTTKEISKRPDKNFSYKKGLAALIHLNTMMAFMPCSDITLRSTSLRLGMVSILTRAVSQEMPRTRQELLRFELNVFGYLMVMSDVLTYCEGVRWAAEALQAGILTIMTTTMALFSEYLQFLGENETEAFERIIRTLSNYLIHYSVVRAAVDALDAIEPEAIKKMEVFSFFPSWTKFQCVLLERAVFMSLLERQITSRERKLHCDYCLKLFPLQELKKCEKCRRTYYCSKACQIMDWRHSNHRNACANLEEKNADIMPLSTLNRLFLGRLACYDIRRNMISLSHIIQKNYPGTPLNRLRFFVFYNAPEQAIGIHIAPFPETPSNFFARAAQCAEDDDGGPCLVQILYYGGTPEYTSFFYFMAPQSYFSAPKLLEQYQDVEETMKVDFRSKVVYWCDPDDPDSGLIEIYKIEDADEVGAILSYIRMKKGKSEDLTYFPSTFKYTWKDIENAALACRRCWPFEDEGIFKL